MGYNFNPFTGNLDLIDTTAAAGSDTQIQYNDNGSLAGSADLSWDDSGKVLDVGGDINLDDGGSFQTTLQLVTPTANRTVTFPDATGTVGLVAGSSGQAIYNDAGAYSGLSTVTTDGTNVTLTGRFIGSLNGAASAPPATLTGTWFTGGTATTTKPQLLLEPAGTTSTAWSTAGTGLGINATSGFTGRLLDLQVNGTSRVVAGGDGRLLVGTSSASTTLGSLTAKMQVQGTSVFDTGITNALWESSTNPAQLQLVKSRGASIGTHTVVQNNDTLGRILFGGSDGTGFITSAWIQAGVDGTPGTNDMPGRLVFSTTADGASSPTERLRITNAGVLQVADAGNITVGTTTGTKIGTATTQKLGFYNATPVVQPTAVADSVDTTDIVAQFNALLSRMRDLGLIAT
jgi:hypothetical protein